MATLREGEPGIVDLLLERAGHALYRAKKSGRNRVASYAPEHTSSELPFG